MKTGFIPKALEQIAIDPKSPKITPKSQHAKIKTQLGAKPWVWHGAELDRLSGAKEIASGVACGSEHCVCLYQKNFAFLTIENFIPMWINSKVRLSQKKKLSVIRGKRVVKK